MRKAKGNFYSVDNPPPARYVMGPIMSCCGTGPQFNNGQADPAKALAMTQEQWDRLPSEALEVSSEKEKGYWKIMSGTDDHERSGPWWRAEARRRTVAAQNALNNVNYVPVDQWDEWEPPAAD